MALNTTEIPVTALLAGWHSGGTDAWNALIARVYRELRRIAGSQLRRERSGATLQPTELVHEACMRIAGARDLNWQGRSHFYGIAARLMRQILIQRARARSAAKRGGGEVRLTLEEAQPIPAKGPDHLANLADALEELAAEDRRKAQIVELRYFAGMTLAEIAVQLGVSLSTVERDMRMALPWLRCRLESAARE
jgi:RNA polymerase sigma factor (TIGR02999 family)